MRQRNFNGLSGLCDTIPKLATASAHSVYVDIGDTYTQPIPADDGVNPTYPVHVDRQAIWNDRDATLSYMGTDTYEITQHAEVLETINASVEEWDGDVDFGMVRDYGSFIDGFVTFEDHSIDVFDVAGEDYNPPSRPDMGEESMNETGARVEGQWTTDHLSIALRFRNSFDASRKLRFETMCYRHISDAWMITGGNIGSFEMYHIDEIDTDAVQDMIDEVIGDKESLADQIGTAIDEQIQIEATPNALDQIGYGSTYQKHIIDVLQAFNPGNTITLWDLYTATTQYLDHEVVDNVVPAVYQDRQESAADILAATVGDAEPHPEYKTVYA